MTAGWVAVVGGACAGSEICQQLRLAGFQVAVFEQNDLPYGKIEDGLPRWHEKQRIKECARIDGKIDQPGVTFIPRCRVGAEPTIADLLNWGFKMVVFANGAWRDRELQVEGLASLGRESFWYQNPLIYWYNHQDEALYRGPRPIIPPGASIIGGGLASIDVAKICQFENVRRALAARGISCSDIQLEHYGISQVLGEHGLCWDDLGLAPARLFYRRTIQEMPLVPLDDEPSQEQKERAKGVREKIVQNACRKFLFEVYPLHAPLAVEASSGNLRALHFQINSSQGGRLVDSGERRRMETTFLISSIGSLPEALPGVPMVGELYDAKDSLTGVFKGQPRVCCVGNAITGKGNIQASLRSASQLGRTLNEGLPLGGDPYEEFLLSIRENARQQVDELIRYLRAMPLPGSEGLPDRLAALQKARGFSTFCAWREARLAERCDKEA
jgi:hypothetical protein